MERHAETIRTNKGIQNNVRNVYKPKRCSRDWRIPHPGQIGSCGVTKCDPLRVQRPVYPINPKATEILGLPAYPSVRRYPGPVDLAMVLVPAQAVPGVIEECGQNGITGAVIISAGFREVGREGRQLEQELIKIAQQYGIRLVGPNVLGIIDTVIGLNASFAAGMPRKGPDCLHVAIRRLVHLHPRHRPGAGHWFFPLLQHRQ